MKKFNVIVSNFNTSEFEAYDVIPYLMDKYKEAKDKPESFDELKKFVKTTAMYQWWSRCEYEIILDHWPPFKDHKYQKKIDVYDQVIMNIDIVTEILQDAIKKLQ